jgi:hypothetical protein
MLNMCGYWYFPRSVTTTSNTKADLSFEIEWLNKGVAPAYASYILKGRLIPLNSDSGSIDFQAGDSGNKNWLPGRVSTEKYSAKITGKPRGVYWLSIQLFDPESERPVDIGLKETRELNGYYLLQKITF